MFDSFTQPGLIDEVSTAARAEAQATARRLNAVADLMQLRERQYGDRPAWAADLWDAVAAELAAALRISPALASGYLRDALAMRERLPKVGQCLAAGEINYTLFQMIAYRTALITDEKALAEVDAAGGGARTAVAVAEPTQPGHAGRQHHRQGRSGRRSPNHEGHQGPLPQCLGVRIRHDGGVRKVVRQHRPRAGSPVGRTGEYGLRG